MPKYTPLKQVIDIGIIILSLPILIPIITILSLCLLFTMGRPVFFWQWRIGQHGRPFKMVKFRTMKYDPVHINTCFTIENDPRITTLGRYLRRFRIDELPQLWNVLRGEMSLIGPRPEQEAFVKQYEDSIPLYSARHCIKPGITGWAQVMQGYTASENEVLDKLHYDLYYIENFSFWLDAKIVVKTLQTILTGFGAR